MASGILLGPGDFAKPSSSPSVALYLQFFWKPVQKKRMTVKIFGKQTKNKKFKTNIFPQRVGLSIGPIKQGYVLTNAQALLVENAEQQWRRKSS